MAKKDADKCKYLAKYIYVVRRSPRKTRRRGRGRGKALSAFLSHPVPAISRKLSPLIPTATRYAVCLWAFLILNYTNYSDMKGNDLTSEEKNVWFLYA